MTTELLGSKSNARVDSVDVLRGLAVMAIVLLHSLEHFNFYQYPKELPFEWMKFTDKAIWDGLFFLFAGKAYAIFSLLFGFSFFIQYGNQQRRGNDFRLRFMWRLVLLLLFGQFNAMFFTGEVLTLYALLGGVLVLTCRLKNKTILILACIFLLQPECWVKMFYALMNPDYEVGKSLSSYYFGIAFKVQNAGTFIETAKMNLWEGQLASLTWAVANGRIFQTSALFMLGMLAGRIGFFKFSKENHMLWLKVLGTALVLFFPLYGLNNMLPDFIERKAVLQPLSLIVLSLAKVSFMAVLVTGFLFLFYHVKDNKFLMCIAPYGKMSLTNYITQSIVGSFVFYHWGLNMSLKMGITYSFIFGICFFFLQLVFCSLWLKKFKHGPFEMLWKKLTWIGTSKK